MSFWDGVVVDADTVDIHAEEIEDEFAVADEDTVDITYDDLEEEFAAPVDETVSNENPGFSSTWK